MELKQLREKSADELNAHLTDLRKEQFSLRMQQVTGQLPKTHETRRVRQDLDRPAPAGQAEIRIAAMSDNQEKSGQRTVEGRVVSNKMDKTVTVLVERQVKHALYGKYIRRSTKLHAHDADNACNEGDVVRMVEIAPLSKTKNWRVVEIVTRAAI
jgi:small subunit ribosomal protein S17